MDEDLEAIIIDGLETASDAYLERMRRTLLDVAMRLPLDEVMRALGAVAWEQIRRRRIP